ncbi:MAG: chromate transporter [Lachnospiraceae bacterium]|jgi:chromate transporter|nr:chromate transporter [Lachnospiraceae bacterium]
MNSVWTLFTEFLKIGFLSIGGGYAIIPLIQEQVVEKAGWISEKMFTDIITISQMTPGPLAVNTSTFVGLQIGGLPGALAATVGCTLCGIVISLVLYKFFQTHQSSVYVLEVLNGLKSASLGLIISAAFTILLLALYGADSQGLDGRDFNRTALLIFLAMLFILRKWKINPVLVMAASGIAGLVCYL